MDGHRGRRGSALLLCIIVSVIILGISGAYLSFSVVSGGKTAQDVSGVQALYLAEAGAALWVNAVQNGADAAAVTEPVDLAQGSYSIPVVLDYGANGVDDDGDGDVDNDSEGDFLRVEALGTYGGVSRRIEVVLSQGSDPTRWTIWAANKSGEEYTLSLDGDDAVAGNVFSGDSIDISGDTAVRNEDAEVDPPAMVMYTDTYTNDSSVEYQPNVLQGDQDPPTLPRDENGVLEIENLATSGTQGYVDVAAELSAHGVFGAAPDPSGWWLGRATQITDPNNPAHIFRKNPTVNPWLVPWCPFPSADAPRADAFELVATPKDDYYLEDPNTASGGTHLGPLIMDEEISGTNRALEVRVSPDGNNATYFIDGNLWVSHDGARTFHWTRPPGDANLKVTLVVKGNINYGDNMVYQDDAQDILAIMAVEDPDYPNVSFHDMTSANAADPGWTFPNGQTIPQFIAGVNALETWALRGNPTSTYHKLNALNLSREADQVHLAKTYNRANGSGNIIFGTIRGAFQDKNSGFMYAENDFYTTGLENVLVAADGTNMNTDPETGSDVFSSDIEIFGSITAGNQIHLGTTRTNPEGNWVGLYCRYDDKIQNGIVPPHLWDLRGSTGGDWQVVIWRQIGTAGTAP